MAGQNESGDWRRAYRRDASNDPASRRAPLSDSTLVAKAIAGALGVFEHPTEPLPNTLERVLVQREPLLLIDNFEHVIRAAPLVSKLLAASSRLKVLVTSREPLRLAGEQEYLVPPLSLPNR